MDSVRGGNNLSERKKTASTRPAGDGVAKPGSVERFRLLLDLLATRAPISISDVAEMARLPLSTAHKTLQEFVASGLAVFDGVRRLYGPGPELHRLAALLTQAGPVTAGVRQVLRDLAEAAQETACLNWLNRDRASYTVLAIEEGPGPLQYVVELGGHLPLHAGASGRAILAFMTAQEKKRYLGRRKVARLTADTIVDGKLLEAALAQSARTGFAISQGERLVGAVGIAAPVFDAQDQVVGSLQLTIPEHRFVRRRVREIATLVKRNAARLRGQLEQVG